MTPALLFLLFCVVLAVVVGGAVAYGMRRHAAEELTGVRRQLGVVAQHLNGDAEAPERFVQLVTKH